LFLAGGSVSNLESNSIILGYLNSVGSSAGSCYINGITVDVTTLPPSCKNAQKIPRTLRAEILAF